MTKTFDPFSNKIINNYKYNNPDPITGTLAFFSPEGSIVYT